MPFSLSLSLAHSPYSPPYGSVANSPSFLLSLPRSLPCLLAGSHCHPRTDHIHQNSLHKHAQQSVGGVCFTPLFALFPLECWSDSNSAYSGSDQTSFPPPRKTHTHFYTVSGPEGFHLLFSRSPPRTFQKRSLPSPAGSKPTRMFGYQLV